MKVLVIYYFLTGNTERLAKAVAKGVEKEGGVECVIKRAREVKREDFLSADAIIAGSPVYFGGMASELKEVFEYFVDIRDEMEGKMGGSVCNIWRSFRRKRDDHYLHLAGNAHLWNDDGSRRSLIGWWTLWHCMYWETNEEGS